LVMLMYFDDLYGIADEISKEWTPKSVQEIHDLIMANKTKEPASMEDVFVEIGLDSLDGLVMLMYFDELYGIEDAISKEWTPASVQELHDLVMAHKTKEPASMEEVKEVCK